LSSPPETKLKTISIGLKYPEDVKATLARVSLVELGIAVTVVVKVPCVIVFPTAIPAVLGIVMSFPLMLEIVNTVFVDVFEAVSGDEIYPVP
jgi:hypothetical protein